MGDETLNGVLRNVFTEVSMGSLAGVRDVRLTLLRIKSQFMSGDFDMIRTFVSE